MMKGNIIHLLALSIDRVNWRDHSHLDKELSIAECHLHSCDKQHHCLVWFDLEGECTTQKGVSELNQLTTVTDKKFSSLLRRILWSAVSKADLRSSSTKTNVLPECHLTPSSVQSQCCNVVWSQIEICPKDLLNLESCWVESKETS